MLTVKTAAAKAGVSPGLVYVWIESGVLTHYRVGKPGRRGSIRIAEDDLDAFMKSMKHEKGPEEKPPTPKTSKKKSVFRHLNLS